MAVLQITANLNGGDETTGMEDLQFQIHNGTDDAILKTYAEIGSENTAGSDAAISVAVDPAANSGDGEVVISGAEVGSVITFKIRCRDAAGNESVLSAAASSGGGGSLFHLNCDKEVSSIEGILSGHPAIGVDEFVEFKMKVNDLAFSQHFFAVAANTTRYVRMSGGAGGIFRHVDPSSAATTESSTTVVPDTTTMHTYRFWKRASGIGFQIDGGTEELVTVSNPSFAFDQLFTRSGVAGAAFSFCDADFEHYNHNGVLIDFPNTSGVYTVGGITLTITSLSGAQDITTNFTPAP